MDFPVLYQDAHVLAVDKPAGVACIDHARAEPSPLVAWLRARFPEVRALGEGPRPAGQVHRLDAATSGLLLIARRAEEYERLRRAFSRTGGVWKCYRALLVGRLAGPLELDWPIGSRGRRSPRVRVVMSPAESRGLRGVRPARTSIAALRASGELTDAEILIATGVRHQIRAHAAAAGHGVLGDALYGPGEALPAGCPERLYLHAWRLRVPAGMGRSELALESPVPECFTRCLKAAR